MKVNSGMGVKWLGTGNKDRWMRAHLCGQGSEERSGWGGFAEGVLLLSLVHVWPGGGMSGLAGSS